MNCKRMLGAALLAGAVAAVAPADNGLIGEYRNKFNQLNSDPFGGTPVWSRVDAQLDLSWTNAPAPGIGANWFTVRWTGALQAPTNGGYVFRTIADQACRLILDGEVLVEGWLLRKGTTSDTRVVTLDVSRRYELIVEYQRTQNEVPFMYLQWRRPGTSVWEFVSNLYLYTTLPESAAAPNRLRYFPRSGYASRMTGGRLTGSLQGETFGFTTLATISGTPAGGQWNELIFTNNTVYRWIKYEAPAGSYGNVAELQFYHNSSLLTGVAFGTVSPTSNDFSKALDGDTDTYFNATLADGQYVGYDLGAGTQVAAPAFTPLPGSFRDEVIVTLIAPTSNSYIKYTLTGATPSWSNSLTYNGPFLLSATKTIVAKAFKPGLADSVNAQGTYTISLDAPQSGLRTYSTGNSLTDTTRSFPALAQSAGYTHQRYEFSIPGAPTDWLWTHPNNGANHYTNQARAYAPVDYYTQQPFAGHGRTVANECAYGGNFFALFQTNSPNMRWLLYQQWPDPSNPAGDRWAKAQWSTSPAEGELELIQRGLTNAAKTYPAAISNHMFYFELLRKTCQAKFPWKKVRIIPSGLALMDLYNKITSGQIPGLSDFAAETYADGIHMNTKGAFLIDLTWYAAFYEENPLDKAFLADTGLTPEQIRIYQQIAWDVVAAYPWSPCGPRGVLGAYETLGLAGNEAALAPAYADARASVGAVTRGAGLSPQAGTISNSFLATGAAATSITGALNNAQYFSFTLAPQSGQRLTLMELRAELFSATGGVNAAVLTSATGFTPSNVLAGFALPPGQTTNHLFDLSRPRQLRGLTNAVELRLYLWSQVAGDGAGVGRAGAANSSNVFDLTAFGVLRESVPPATPLGLNASTSGVSMVDLQWNAATDNVAVAGYNIYWNGQWLDGTTGVTYRHAIAPYGSNVYTVAAFDDEMNVSAPSAPVVVMTVPEGATACALAIAAAALLRRR